MTNQDSSSIIIIIIIWGYAKQHSSIFYTNIYIYIYIYNVLGHVTVGVGSDLLHLTLVSTLLTTV